MTTSSMSIERLGPQEWERLRTVRLRALKDAPNAFATTLREADAWSADVWRQQAANIVALVAFIAKLDGQDAGIVRGTPDTNDPSAAFLISMWVAPTARGKGVGDALIDALVGWGRGTGVTRIFLDVGDDNGPAIALYERHGFVATGETGCLPPPREHIREHRRELKLATLAST
jgi:ribosomal protein S18 acetylase RimI-like enzyme